MKKAGEMKIELIAPKEASEFGGRPGWPKTSGPVAVMATIVSGVVSPRCMVL